MLPLYEDFNDTLKVFHRKSRHISPHLHKSIEFVYNLSSHFIFRPQMLLALYMPQLRSAPGQVMRIHPRITNTIPRADKPTHIKL